MSRLSTHTVKSVTAQPQVFPKFWLLTIKATQENGQVTEFEMFSDHGPLSIEWLPVIVAAPKEKA